MAAHEQDDKLHLHMAIDTISSLKDTVNSQHDELNPLHDITESLVTLKSGKSLTFVISEFQKKKGNDEEFTTPHSILVPTHTK